MLPSVSGKNMNDYSSLIRPFLDEYLRMEINGIEIACPYWMNKIRKGKVVLRGFANGKGTAGEIKKEILRNINLQACMNDKSSLYKLAKRERIGIDCSGLSYRILDKLLDMGYAKEIKQGFSLNEVFSGGIDRTNVIRFTSSEYAVQVEKISEVKLGDVIRMMRGKHMLVILTKNSTEIKYIHSSKSTEIYGVHEGIIKIKDWTEPLEKQEWQEITRKGENFGRRYFHPESKDGIYRLRIFS